MAAPDNPAAPSWEERLHGYREQLACGFPQVAEVFEECLREALVVLSASGLDAYLDTARFLGGMGRGVEPPLLFLEEWPAIARTLGEDALPAINASMQALGKSPNARAITPFLQTLAAVARRLPAARQMQRYLDLTQEFTERTTGSIHGIHQTFASPGLPDFFAQAPTLLDKLSIGGLRKWVDYGIRNYANHPERQRDYFSLKSADSRAVLQRERHGTLLVDHQRLLDLYLRGLWGDSALLVPYPSDADQAARPAPYYDADGIRLPDVLDDAHGVSGIDRYRATLAHIAGHRRWSTPMFADNCSPMQRLAIEVFEDSRIETLLMRVYPGLRRTFLALHPAPRADACDPASTSCLRHRLSMFSRALLDSEHGYHDAELLKFVGHFHETMAQGDSSSEEIADLALAYIARTRRQSDQLASVHFADTDVGYRDDNRHLWRFHELSDDEEMFDEPRPTTAATDVDRLLPRHYREWDYQSQSYRPDWVSLYESLHPAGDAGDIDRLLEKHAALARRLKRLLDILKPQDKVRIRYREDGSELDLDVAIRSLIDFKGGANPDPRINMSHRTNGRNLAVLVLLDLSQSLADKVKVGTGGGEQSILELSQEAVSLLAWSIEQLGDPFAIAGFHSDSRHDVRYLHLKGYSERWGDAVKSRLAAMQAGYSTRMGAAMRHAAHYLAAQKADKKLLLLLTDGQPADVDVHDERLLIEDARKAVEELDQQGIFTYCINLDRQADDYVGDIFGRRYTVIDNIERLPERLPELFMALTR
ncbi:VWA domain-containing protein [Candidatus Accumulibacter sp. ACC003]|jgi:nitric oxide reductase NorD protein|uniref:nitric oxide reductase activation protein NorD n=1 Tax=Candidatus Accumulibacter sp. ACC003 TaxID=2823334 RepID=UPI0025B9ED27|nr:VWA domain-containing protein [Candidatus Accumulibacter sp. ACC003]